jgi:hypothetical protein
MAGGLIGSILNFIKRVWDFIKKIVVKIVSFFKHIVGWARNALKSILQNKEEQNKENDLIPVVIKDIVEKQIKEKLKNKDEYSEVHIGLKEQVQKELENEKKLVVQCFYDRKKGEIVDWENTARVIFYEDLDTETKRAFGDKDMIILQ